MKTKNIVLLLLLTAVVAIIIYSYQGTRDGTNYNENIRKEREENNRFMKTSAQSPITDKENFTGLNYFEPDLRYRIIADLIPVDNKKILTLATNDGKEQRYVEYAYAEFELDQRKNRLLILEGIDNGAIKGKVFIAFGDETSAIDTYGGGRYLDVNKVPGATTITLDFNKAYNPYCAYNETYSCPLPPRENLLKVAIRAGEKIYKE